VNPMRTAYVVDLFCGVGGMTHGFVCEGFNVVAGLDVDPSCKYAYEKNNPSKFIQKDICQVTGDEITKLYPPGAIKILIGCAPCQPFSSYARSTQKNKKSKRSDGKWRLLYEFARIINETQPDIVSMENVSQLLNYNKHPVFKNFVKNLESQDYFVSFSVVNCTEYGLPQKRKRLVLFASKFGPLKIIDPTYTPECFVTVREAIGGLPSISAGEVSKTDPLHRTRNLSELNKKRIRATSTGGSWKEWPKDLLLKCHKKKKGKSFRSVYGRMSWNEPSPTITTECIQLGSGRFGHPVQDRAISLREAAILQSFPEDYDFTNPDTDFSSGVIAMHIGNAVPVILGRVVAKTIERHLAEVEKTENDKRSIS